MAVVHFLNVGEGDCSVIYHDTGNVTVIDLCNAHGLIKSATPNYLSRSLLGGIGNYNQRNNSTNPIQYMKTFGHNRVFRFILTHPDMDHMDGLVDFFQEFQPINFWDIANNKTVSKADLAKSKFDERDWSYYQSIRCKSSEPTTLKYYAGTENKYFNKDDYGSNGDGLYVLAPFKDLVDAANQQKNNDYNDYNDCSYVLMFVNQGRKIIFAGDSHDETWEKILADDFVYRKHIEEIDVLIAPHHGRKSGRDFSFLDILKPKLTLFGIAPSEHLAYDAWNQRKFMKITNYQAGNIVMNISQERIDIYVEKESHAKNFNNYRYEISFMAYNIGWI